MRIRRGQHLATEVDDGSDGEEPLVDMTKALSLHSKRTERQRKKLQKKAKKATEAANLLSLPTELLVDIIELLLPSDCLRLASVCRDLNQVVQYHGEAVAKHLIDKRYSSLAKSFPRPVYLSAVDAKYHDALLSKGRQRMLEIHKRPYQHVKSPEPTQICSCLTCILAWNNLCLLVDLAHWQGQLDRHEPLPIIERGTNPEWNLDLVAKNATIVDKSIRSTLWYALILERHLDTTVRTIRRYKRTGKSTVPYDMTAEDADSGTDRWLERKGPDTYEFPWRRDTYYHLEAYVPNRKYSSEQHKWLYQPASQHDRDIEWALSFHERHRSQIPSNIQTTDLVHR
ncbi:hypothetical protein NA57DRAFT_60205 [Rhizodiscina lignyota]|uniref:F-box domain-containing protein n=1 Tax=Rhizodiscina lignyota TaxID=1504668 RepID=A0A9P4IAL6_9PEZI|nr:hypothetical protein NA57DRAFT_60205 [Rhizodiscina lignyota]